MLVYCIELAYVIVALVFLVLLVFVYAICKAVGEHEGKLSACTCTCMQEVKNVIRVPKMLACVPSNLFTSYALETPNLTIIINCTREKMLQRSLL